MKTVLTPQLVKRLSLDEKPVGIDGKGKILFEPNPEAKEYFVFCTSQESPKGFGLRVTARTGRKTWILQRRVGPKVVRSKVGDAADYTLEEARERARGMAKEMISTGLNPNETARKIAAGELTVGGVMTSYLEHLKTRKNKPAKPNTVKNFERAKRRFEELKWDQTRVRDLTVDEVVSGFNKKAQTAPTANEQNFSWLSRAIRFAIDRETLDAFTARREPTLVANPLSILKLEGHYRDPALVEAEREQKARKPLGPVATLGKFLEALWARRSLNDNATGVDFCLTEVLVGARKGELGTVAWGELLSQAERDEGRESHVWLEEEGDYGPYLFLSSDVTKNRRAHRVPLGPFLVNLLKRRRDDAAEETLRRGFGRKGRKWVFPARNKASQSGQYKDAGHLLDAIAAEIDVAVLNPHDLRRTFGSIMVGLEVPNTLQSRLFNHTVSTSKDDRAAAVTARYSRPEWLFMREWAEKVQEHALTTAPNVYNSLKPPGHPALPARDPHIPTPPKPRTGRPKKAAADAV